MNRKALWIGLLLLISYLLFSNFVGGRTLNNFDYQTTVFLQSVINPSLNTPLSTLSLIGSFEISSLILFFILLNLVRYNLHHLSANPKFLLHFSREKLKSLIIENKIILIIAFFYVAILGFELIGKNAIYHPNPPQKFFRYSIPFNFPSSHVSTNYSYPSGHSARTAFISIVTLWYLLSLRGSTNWQSRSNLYKKATIFIAVLIFDILMIISRPYLGEHWSTDVVGGFLLGASMAFFSASLQFSSRDRPKLEK